MVVIASAFAIAFAASQGYGSRPYIFMKIRYGGSLTATKTWAKDGDVASLVRVRFAPDDGQTAGAAFRFYNLYTANAIGLQIFSEDRYGFLVTLNTGAGHGLRVVYFSEDPRTSRVVVGLDAWSYQITDLPAIAFDKNGNPVITTIADLSTVPRTFAFTSYG